MKHFKFGENWKNFSNLIDNNRLKEAVISLKKLTNKKVIALGGVSRKNIKIIFLTNCFGFAGISYFE